jgi:tripartite-type tricarboxylate transporter receptor subunit TctC
VGTLTRKLKTCIAAPFAAALLAAMPAAAQDYPSKPLRAITTMGAGGLSDIFIRAIGQELQKRWGQTLIVENRPGGMHNIGARACAESPPDGYTICIIYSDPLAFNPHLFKKLPFDDNGQQPVTNLFYLLQMLAVSSDLNVKTMDELVALSKAKPGTLNYTSGTHTVALYMDKLKQDKGADWVRVPFKGGADAVNAVLGGTTQIAILGEGNVIPHIKSGKMTPIVMVNNLKSPNFPNVPTLAEIGYQGPPSRDWFGLFMPAGTPPALVDKVSKEISSIVNEPEFKARHLTARSLVAATGTPAQFAEQIKKDRAAAETVIKGLGMQPQ